MNSSEESKPGRAPDASGTPRKTPRKFAPPPVEPVRTGGTLRLDRKPSLERRVLIGKLEDALNDIVRWLQSHPPGEQRAHADHLDEHLRALLRNAKSDNDSAVSNATRDSLPAMKGAMKSLGGRFPWQGLQTLAELFGLSASDGTLETSVVENSEEATAGSQAQPGSATPRLIPEKTDNMGKRRSNDRPPIELPATWEDLRKLGSIDRTYAAQLLRCDRRTISRRVGGKELKQSSKGRICCDDLLKIQIRKVHGAHVLK